MHCKTPRSSLSPLVLPLVLITLAASGCLQDEPAGPSVEYQVIEEVTFAESLGIDLDAMTVTEEGIYIQDLTPGDGPEADWGDNVEIVYSGYLHTGVQYLPEDTIGFQLGGEVVPEGVQIAMLGQQAGGERLMIIPPRYGYGAREYENVPAGSILIFRVELLDLVN
ncbi:MAG: FKBP-type peptidyl-prolyl cis-trans isomerase [Gemmatimonadota bacterium]